jgi:hypothetical protein
MQKTEKRVFAGIEPLSVVWNFKKKISNFAPCKWRKKTYEPYQKINCGIFLSQTMTKLFVAIRSMNGYGARELTVLMI